MFMLSVIPLLFINLIIHTNNNNIVDAKSSIARNYRPLRVESSTSTLRKRKDDKETNDDAYVLLARAIQDRLTIADVDNQEAPYDLSIITSALRSLSKTQSALKKIDGAAHEAYQRTHRSSTSLDDDDNEDDENDDNDDYDDDKNNNPNSAKGSSSTTIGGLKVAGRMSRNAARIGCVANALFAAELCEFGSGVDYNDSNNNNNNDDDGTLASWTGREVILNTTISTDDLIISVLILYERGYDGGVGVDHGSVDDLLSSVKSEIGVTVISEDRDVEEGKEESDDVVEMTKSSKTVDNYSAISSSHNPTSAAIARGRFLVILSDHLHISRDLSSIMSVLDKPPRQLRLRHDESTSVCESLYQTANKVLDVIGPVIAATSNSTSGSNNNNVDGVIVVNDSQKVQQPAIHFVGYSLAGGVAAISACIIDGSLPLLLRRRSNSKDNQQQHDNFASPSLLNGSGRARTSALCLGPPPCISSNVKTPFITSIIHGDDVVCRTSRDTIDSLCDCTRRTIKGGILGRSVGWMSQAVKLTVSGLTSSSSNRLVIPGQVYLVRPRRIGGGSSSIHEVDGRGGNTLRATLLWQLNDILLSKSLWSHHRLETYIRSLDRVGLKGFADQQSIEQD
jgi:hypothetical protein